MLEYIPEIRSATYHFVGMIGFLYICGVCKDDSPSTLRLLLVYLLAVAIEIAWKS